MASLLALSAYALLSLALYVSNGLYNTAALVLVVAALVAALFAGGLGPGSKADGVIRGQIRWLLPAVMAVQLAPTALAAVCQRHDLTAWVQLAFCILPVFWLSRSLVARRLTLALMFGCFIFLFGAKIVLARPPFIDVWHLQQQACAELLAGRNPYSAHYPNIYAHTAFYGEGCLAGNKVTAFPYPPISLLLAVPGYLLGDVRWSLLAAFLGTVLLMLATGRRLGLPAGHPAELAALAALYHPGVFLVLRSAWTEPFLALAFAFLLWRLSARRSSTLAAALVLSIKQYGILLLPALLWQRRRGGELLVGAGLALAAASPFILWNAHDFVDDLLWFQVRQPFRWDALSLLTAVDKLTAWRPSALIGFVAAGAAVAFTAWRPPRTLSASLCQAAVTLLAFFAFNKQAFFNYYWLITMPLLLALIASEADAVALSSASSDEKKDGEETHILAQAA